jgi:hypothetical protein
MNATNASFQISRKCLTSTYKKNIEIAKRENKQGDPSN